MESATNHTAYRDLLEQIGEMLRQGQVKAVSAVQQLQLLTYWHIGRYIVEYEQQGQVRADYGSFLLDHLSKDLTARHGKSFSRSNLVYIRKLYQVFPISESLTHQLTWTHYIELLKIDDELARGFYLKQAEQEHWGVRELKRQIKASLFHRLALSRDRAGILALARQGQLVEKPADIIRDPYMLEFLQLPTDERVLEGDLEQRLIDNLQTFLLELGKGFAFIGRQYRIPIAGRNYRVDLVFYHRILKCFVLIDLKRSEVDHQDIGQMNFYLNYVKKEENMPDDNDPIGIILGASRDDVFVEYALSSIQNAIFVSRYQIYLPDKAQLENELRRLLTETPNPYPQP
jgi:predicted nuclease of restriction endonuclease-like (RecB) superfamily